MQIPPEVRKCVAFLAVTRDDLVHFVGTIFLIGKEIEGTDVRRIYGVTAKHVVEDLLPDVDELLMRVNVKDGTAQWFKMPIGDFMFHPTDPSVDIAVLPIPYSETWDVTICLYEMLLTPTRFDSDGYTVGDEVFLTGLFHPHSGENRNIPIIRVGTLAAPI